MNEVNIKLSLKEAVNTMKETKDEKKTNLWIYG